MGLSPHYLRLIGRGSKIGKSVSGERWTRYSGFVAGNENLKEAEFLKFLHQIP